MFGRERAEVVTVPSGLDDEPQPQPRQRPAASESRCFQPSNFASRKAEAEAAKAVLSTQRLVSLGATEFAERDLRKGGDVNYRDAELFCDIDHPMRRFVRIEGGPLMALQDESKTTDEVLRLPPLKGGGRPGSSPDPRRPSDSLPTPPPRPV